MASFDDYQAILFKRRGRVLEVTLNRPDKLNATDAILHAELARVFVDINNDPDSDVVVLTGAGRAFSAGGDIGWMQEMIDRENGFDQTAREAKQIVFGLIDCEKPVICKMNGHAVGLGATVALLADVIFAAETAKIGDPHVGVGLVAGDGGAAIWAYRIGLTRAKEFLLTGDLLTAKRAAEIGLINHALPAEELDGAVDAFCQRLLDGASTAIRYTKVLTNLELKRIAHAVMDAGIAYESLTVRTADHREAVQALKEKRKPVFKGK